MVTCKYQIMKTYYALLAVGCIILFSCRQPVQKKEKSNSATVQLSDSSQIKTRPTSEKSIEQFVPDDYFILDSANSSTENNKFLALVLAPVLEQEKDSFVETNRRLVILKETTSGWEKMAQNDELILCRSCGGVFGDPYDGLDIEKNLLTISNYGGSAWRWGNVHIFRYQNNQWELIGATYDYYFNVIDCNDEVGSAGRQFEDINFASGKMQIIHTKDQSCEPYENYWKNFEKKTPITLSDFPGEPSQWPNGKVLDGDGKD